MQDEERPKTFVFQIRSDAWHCGCVFKSVVYTRQIEMLTGKKFRLTSATIGVIATSEPKTVVRIPRDAVVQVLSGPIGNDRTLDVVYDGQTLMMFVDDIVHGAEEIA
jgi:hypothetical protein